MTLPPRFLRSLRPLATRSVPALALARPVPELQRRTYATPIPGPTVTPQSLAYVTQFRDRASAAGYDQDTIARLMDAEVVAGRMPPEGPGTMRAIAKFHKISVAFLILVMGAMMIVPIARHGRNLLPAPLQGAPEKKERVVPRPRRLGERANSE
ncbi:hypothetical protein CcaverHIS002_0207460 [Cutaneotrichosporon cavernicola]|uniref:Uncharacterized protein n=1 Tax=Cutaneotrichosporon cavernicola TaxID=279322 RepID=A0AA48I4W0_9TREE|nr:uncharacterized protein CcaverHIS019_0207440 [Cutaneotrichosporon cavernicola]BEI81586.1 hypothetical protein CcaverHIS002_0207460 [Cutaneotrichosporon cavernicola]BEI89382.1 hypothetical protein CcaverHIS019_0207440 [Cutaneotrichosporon cavernicola]BEI97157.1 hypothetical protein CcaverHIS631_0207460 [Cutaneotrichosporon cavernicola]BEJ04930.1 hypothetical protein CcaverHIS641_0207470 [Cutaneotrichosporon cavernicola]